MGGLCCELCFVVIFRVVIFLFYCDDGVVFLFCVVYVVYVVVCVDW